MCIFDGLKYGINSDKLSLNVTQSFTLATVLANESLKLAPITLNLPNLLDEALSEVLNELDHLVADTEKDIANIFLPIVDHCWNELIILDDCLSHCLDLFEALELTLIAVVNKVYFFFINETLDALVDRLFVRPEVQWYFVLWAYHSALSSRSHQLFLVFVVVHVFICLLQVVYRVY